MLEVVPTGCRQGGVEPFGPFLVSVGKAPNPIRREADPGLKPALLHRYGDALANEYRSIAADQLPHHIKSGAGHEGSSRWQLQIEVRRACTTGRGV